MEKPVFARNSRASGPGSARPPPGRALLQSGTNPKPKDMLRDKLPHTAVENAPRGRAPP